MVIWKNIIDVENVMFMDLLLFTYYEKKKYIS
jgi:hypothetical protein